MRPKTLYYVPGLITAVVLPLLLVYFDTHRPVEKTSLALFLPSDKKYTDDEPRFTEDYVYKAIAGKKITKFYLEAHSYIHDDRSTYLYNTYREFLVDEFRKFKFTRDTMQVLQIKFTRGNSYGDFVWIVNLAILHDIRRFAYVDNSIYFWADRPLDYLDDPPSEYERSLPMAVTSYDPPSRWEVFLGEMKWQLGMAWAYISYHYITVIAFVLLIIAPAIFWLIRSRKRLAYQLPNN